MRRTRSLPAAATVAVLGAALAVPASATATAAPNRVPPWPTVTSALPTGLLRPATTTTAAYLARLKSRLDRRVRASALGGDVSVRVEDLATGQLIYSHRSGQAQVPASTQKTAVALGVLSALGPDHVLRTRVVRSGDTITLVGGGDPVLRTDDVSSLARDAASALEASDDSTADPDPKFRVAYDDSLFAPPSLPSGWYSSYVGNYSANPTALTRYGSYSSDSAGDTARLFRKQLKAAGVRTAYGVIRQNAPQDAELVAEFTDHTVADAIWPMLKFSDNTIAEVMIRHVARARGTATTTTGAAAALRSELGRLGIPVGNMRPVDGSGLSRGNRISARTLVAITRASVNPADPGLSAGFRYSAFPVSGVSGTLESRFKSRQTSCAAGRIMAKTGTLSDTLALSGVTGSTDGRPRAFAIMVNSKPGWASLDSARFRVDRIAAAINGCR